MASMKPSTCAQKAREDISPEVRRRLAHHSHFACSICGSIPIVLHHIEEWSKKHSNDEKFLIPICDKCHRRIHGKGSAMYSKDELYEFKANPDRPPILTDKLPLERKKGYSFFVGCNFIASGESVSLFRFPNGHCLTSIDTSAGVLKLNVLAGLDENEPVYLIGENELMVDSQDVWDMRYSGSSLKIWRTTKGEKTIFIDLSIKPDVIIIKRMSTSFNGRPFKVRKLRSPRRRQVDKIASKVKQYERIYRETVVQIDSRPRIDGVFGEIDVDTLIKQTQKDKLKMRMEQDLSYGFYRNFKWSWPYYQWVLDSVLMKSPVFRKEREIPDLPVELRRMHEMIASIRAKYQKDFEDLSGVVVEYDGIVWLDNINL